MAWQKCPVCNGTGAAYFSGNCTVCNGAKIINEITGLPPVVGITISGTNVTSKSTDFRDNQEQFEDK